MPYTMGRVYYPTNNHLYIFMEAYCVKCKAKREMKDGKEVTFKNGRKAMQGLCVKCGTKMIRILPGAKKKE